VNTITETKIETKYEPIVKRYSKEVFDYLLIIIPMYKTVYYDKIVGRIVYKYKYIRNITYYSDGTNKYDNWIHVSTNSYKEYY
jgi:hypothetical protein